jgi:hypothetical protein
MRTAAWSRRATIFLSLCGIGLLASFGACSKSTDTESTAPTTTTSSAGGSGAGGGAGGQASVCTDCHGSAQNAAPPLDMNGLSDTSEPTVGAHQSHLAVATWHGPLTCTDCHLLPASTKCPDPDTHHCDGVIDLVFNPLLADAHGAITSYDFNTYTCTGGYCHGSTLEADISGNTSIRAPVFNVVDESQIACGTGCHSNPPGEIHPTGGSCEDQGCHSEIIASFDGNSTPNTATWVNGSRHIDGVIDFD